MKKSFSKVMLAVLFLSVLTAVVMVTPPVKAQLTVSLSPTSGAVGSSVTVTVSGFTAGDTALIDLAGSNFPSYELGVINIGSTGSGTNTFTIPSSQNPYYGVTYSVTPGSYTITANSYYYTGSVSASFTVTASTSATSSPTPASSATPAPSTSATPTSTPKIPEFSSAALIMVAAAMVATVVFSVVFTVRKKQLRN